jgi:hypothetical protein
MAPASSPYLPDALSPTYQIALRKNPAFTAKLFLQAYEDVAASGPVTSDAVQAYVQRQIASGPQPARGGIVSAKLNTEGFITRLDVKLGGATPKPLGAIFEFSAAQEALMSFEESVAFGQELFSAQPEENIFPIESYLMLFDLDGDGTVAREEVERALTGFMREARQVTRFEEVGEDLRR